MLEFFSSSDWKTRKKRLLALRRNGSGVRLNRILFDHFILLLDLQPGG
jgi:hypothetical protein